MLSALINFAFFCLFLFSFFHQEICLFFYFYLCLFSFFFSFTIIHKTDVHTMKYMLHVVIDSITHAQVVMSSSTNK